MALAREGLLERSLSNDREGTFTLARLGQPVESFAGPESLSGTTAEFHDRLRRRLRTFRPDQAERRTLVLCSAV